MSAVHHRGIRKREKFGLNRVHQCGGISAREIGPSHGATEKDIAPENHPGSEEAHAAGGVTGREANFEAVLSQLEHLTGTELSLGRRRGRQAQAQPAAVLGKCIIKRPVQWMEMDGSAGGAMNRAYAHDMIHVRVGKPDTLQLPAVSAEFGQESIGLLAGIDDDGLSRDRISHQVTILHEGAVRQRNDLELRHRQTLSEPAG